MKRSIGCLPERVAIGEAIEAELQGRHGTHQHTKEDVENFPSPAGPTRDLAAKAAGFGNGKTYEQAKRVTDTTRRRRYTQRVHLPINWALRA